MDAPAKPTLGRIVIYRSTTTEETSIEPQVPDRVAYELPAIVTAVQSSLWGKGVAQGHVRDLSDEMHVHLTVFSCGDATLGGNSGGTYQEFNVRHSEDKEPGTWAWPERV